VTTVQHAWFARCSSLTPVGSNGVFDVLEYCDGADSVADIAQRLITVLPRVYRFRFATFFSGHTLSSAIEDAAGADRFRQEQDRLVQGAPEPSPSSTASHRNRQAGQGCAQAARRDRAGIPVWGPTVHANS